MSKRSVLTTITPIPGHISRETVMETLRDHLEMIDLNPLVIDRKKIPKAPSFASPEEYHATWYEITDKVSYLPGGLATGNVTYHGCFHDLPDGLQTHVYAPLGLDIKSKWLLGGNLPGEPAQAVEMGLNIPRQGLYLREDVDMKCNFLMTSFVKATLKKSHSTLVDRLVEKAKIRQVNITNTSLAVAAESAGYQPHGMYRNPTVSVGSSASTPSIPAVSPPYPQNAVPYGGAPHPGYGDPAYQNASPFAQKHIDAYHAGLQARDPNRPYSGHGQPIAGLGQSHQQQQQPPKQSGPAELPG